MNVNLISKNLYQTLNSILNFFNFPFICLLVGFFKFFLNIFEQHAQKKHSSRALLLFTNFSLFLQRYSISISLPQL